MSALEEQRAARADAAQLAYQAATEAPVLAVAHAWKLTAPERELLTEYVAASAAGATVPANLYLQAASGAVVALPPVDAAALLGAIVTRRQRLRVRLYVLLRDIAATDNPAVVDVLAEWQ